MPDPSGTRAADLAAVLHEDASASALALILDRHLFGWREWEEVETLKEEMARAAGMRPVDLIGPSWSRVLALKAALVTDAFWTVPDVFENTVIAFNGEEPTIGVLEGFEVHEAAWTIVELRRLGRSEAFEHDVLAYAAGVMGDQGWVLAPPELSFLQADLDEYALQGMTQAQLDAFKEGVKKRANAAYIRDEDEDPIDVAVRRRLGCAMYVDAQEGLRKALLARLGAS